MYENYATIRYSGDHCPFAILVCCGGRGRLQINIILGYTFENPSRGSFTFAVEPIDHVRYNIGRDIKHL